MDVKLFVATKAALIFEKRILVIREASSYIDGSNVGLYDLPGGRLKPGESFEQSLLREVLEETGIEVTNWTPFHVSEWRPIVNGEAWQVVGIFFKCVVPKNTVKLGSDHNDYQWVSLDKYKQLNLTNGAKSAFTRLSEHPELLD